MKRFWKHSKKTISDISETLDTINNGRMRTWIDSLTFGKILLLWTSIVVAFGGIYFFMQGSMFGDLIIKGGEDNSLSLGDSIYFSFITATTTGFGDIVPTGMFRAIAIIEVITGLLLLAVITSKIVSLKQDIILEELYEITLTERVNRLRASLLYFRQTITNINHKIEDENFSRRETKNLYLQFSSFQETLHEILPLLQNRNNKYIKRIDSVNTGLLLNSINHSLHRVNNLVHTIENSNVKWQTIKNRNSLNNIIKRTEQIYKQVKRSHLLEKTAFESLDKDSKKFIEQIKNHITIEKDNIA